MYVLLYVLFIRTDLHKFMHYALELRFQNNNSDALKLCIIRIFYVHFNTEWKYEYDIHTYV